MLVINCRVMKWREMKSHQTLRGHANVQYIK